MKPRFYRTPAQFVVQAPHALNLRLAWPPTP